MKKLFLFLTVFILLANGCSAPVSPAFTPAPSTQPSSTPQPSPTATPLPPTNTPSAPTLTPTATPWPRVPAGEPLGFIRGIAMPSWSVLNYAGRLSDESLAALRDTGARWVELVPSFTQKAYDTIGFDFNGTASKQSLAHAIQQAHSLGLSVMLKPQIDLLSDPDHWQGDIGLTFTEDQWRQWFASYTEVMLAYAHLAEDNQVDLFCIGTELVHPQVRAAEWIQLASDIREVYHGPLTYAAVPRFYSTAWKNDIDISWWEAVDYIGIDGYFRLTNQPNPTLQQLEAAWEPYFEILQQIAKKHNRPLIFTEIGYPSSASAALAPDLRKSTVVDLDLQARIYQSVFNRFAGQPWFQGMFWWMWEDSPYQGGACSITHSPKDKPAENVLRQEFGAPLKDLPAPVRLPVVDESKFNILNLLTSGVTPEGTDFAFSWDVKTRLDTSRRFQDNSASIEVKYPGNGGFQTYIGSPLDTSPYQWVEFEVYSDNPDLTLYIFAINASGNDIITRPLIPCLDFETPRLEPGQWTRVLVPLNHIEAENRLIHGFAFFRLGKPGPTTVWFDQVRLVGQK
jgi:hypothetical protein